MIISASYRTDIPAFYGEWFLKRLAAGYCKVVNPYNGAPYVVPLGRESVDGFVFWTKNLGPFLGRLNEVASRGFPFVVQHTINGYPRELESAVIPASASVGHAREVARAFGEDVVVWRYDPIVLSSLTPLEFHLSNFAAIARSLSGAVNEVVVSFMHLYQKTRRNLERAAQEGAFVWHEPDSGERLELLSRMVGVARENGISLSLCAQPQNLVPGVAEAHCVDARRLERIAKTPIDAPLRGNREQCKCFQSRDIGDYDTCPQGCVYCYAVRQQALAKERYQRHNPESPYLFEPDTHDTTPLGGSRQLPLLQD